MRPCGKNVVLARPNVPSSPVVPSSDLSAMSNRHDFGPATRLYTGWRVAALSASLHSRLFLVCRNCPLRRRLLYHRLLCRRLRCRCCSGCSRLQRLRLPLGLHLLCLSCEPRSHLLGRPFGHLCRASLRLLAGVEVALWDCDLAKRLVLSEDRVVMRRIARGLCIWKICGRGAA